MKVSCTLHFKGGNIYIAILIKGIKRQRLINQYIIKRCLLFIQNISPILIG